MSEAIDIEQMRWNTFGPSENLRTSLWQEQRPSKTERKIARDFGEQGFDWSLCQKSGCKSSENKIGRSINKLIYFKLNFQMYEKSKFY